MKKNGVVCIIVILSLGLVFTPIHSAFRYNEAIDSMFCHIYGGNTLYVGGNGPGNYTKIQDAIDNASEGDSIFVFQGIYYEALTIVKRLCIRGEGKEITIIDAQKKGYTVNISADGVNISGFTIQNGSYSSNLVNKANLFIYSSFDNTITGNIFGYSELGIRAYKSGRNTISGNIISNNDVGIMLSGSKNIVTKNLITDNSEMGIATFTSENIISGNIVINNKGTGLYFVDSNKNEITDNEISNNSVGIILTWYNEQSQNRDNVISRNNLRNNTEGNAVFAEHKGFSGKNIWIGNYWGKSRILPKPIFGLKQTRFYYPLPQGPVWLFIPWFCFDWRPARQPYNITIPI